MTDVEQARFDKQNEELNGICPGLYRDATNDPVITNTEERVKATGKAGLLFCIIGMLMLIANETGDMSGRLTFSITATAFIIAAVYIGWQWRKP